MTMNRNRPSPKVRELIRRLREMTAEAERLTNERDSYGNRQHARGLGYMLGGVEALAQRLEAEGLPAPRKVSIRGATVVLFFTLAASTLAACGSVDQQGAGGDVAADSGAGGAAGRDTGGSAGGVFGAGGSAGGSAAGTAGAAGGRDGAAGAAGAAGAGGGASTAPACRGTFIGATSDRVCPQIAGTPQHPGGWQCEIDCSSSAADNAGGCIFNGVTYCVSSCDACWP